MTASLFDHDPATPAKSGASMFDDGKEPDALRTIGEVARALDIRQHVLRYWEEQFPALQPIKRSGGRRYYRPEDVALIVQIHRLVHREGYTLRGAAKALGTGTSPTPSPIMPEATAPKADESVISSRIVNDLKVLRGDLARALAAA